MSKKIDRTGECRVLSNGMSVTIIKYRNSHDIDVLFSDGTVGEHLTYSHFKKGNISGKHRHFSVSSVARLGMRKTFNCGLSGKIVKYNNSQDLDVELETGEIVNTRWKTFVAGEVLPVDVSSHYTINKRAKDKYIGMTKTASNGMKMTLVDYIDRNHIKIQFEDGYETESRLAYFLKGGITNPNYTIYDYQKSVHNGEKKKNNLGLLMELVKYNGWNDILVRFEDGTEIKSTYGQWKSGKIENPNFKRERRNVRTGEEKIATCGLKMRIKEYRSGKDIDVEFEDGSIVKTHYTSFKKGNVGHPTLKTWGKGRFAGFNTNGIKFGYFECVCDKCGYRDILKIHQMIEHEKICKITK